MASILYENLFYFYNNYFFNYFYSINQLPGYNPVFDYICHHAVRTQKFITTQPYLFCGVLLMDVMTALFIAVAIVDYSMTGSGII